MTDLRKIVRRKTTGTYDHHGRRIVVMLEPGDVIAFREERTRKWFKAPIRRVMQQVLIWNVDAARAAKKAERKARKEMR